MARDRPDIPEMPGGWMTIAQASRDFNVGRSTLEYWIRKRRLPGTRRVGSGAGQVVLVLRSEVAARAVALQMRKELDQHLHP